MAIGRILGNNKDMGSGFMLATSNYGPTRVVLTASHVVDNYDASSILFATQSGRRIPVERVVKADDLDIAVLYLSEDVSSGLAKSCAVENAGWKVETQPRGNDPMLKGTIDTIRWRIVTKSGIDIYVLQLKVNEYLSDYKGYSGSPVMLDSPSGGVIGILIEQLLSRLAGTIGQPRPATNVLYAIPIQDVLDRFDLHNVPTSESSSPPTHTSAPAGQSLPKRITFDQRKIEVQLDKLQARATALNHNLKSITEQRDNGIIDIGRFMLLENNLNRQRSEILQEAAKLLEGLDEDFDSILQDTEAYEQESALMERLAHIAKQKGLAQRFVASIERQQGTPLFWLMEVGKQLAKQAP